MSKWTDVRDNIVDALHVEDIKIEPLTAGQRLALVEGVEGNAE